MYYPLSTVKVSDHFELHLLIAEHHSVRLLILQHICSASAAVRNFGTFRQVSLGARAYLIRRNLTYIARNYSASLEDFPDTALEPKSVRKYLLRLRRSRTTVAEKGRAAAAALAAPWPREAA